MFKYLMFFSVMALGANCVDHVIINNHGISAKCTARPTNTAYNAECQQYKPDACNAFPNWQGDCTNVWQAGGCLEFQCSLIQVSLIAVFVCLFVCLSDLA